MARNISQLSTGTTFYIDETINGITYHIPHFYLGLNDNASIALRKSHAVMMQMGTANYQGSNVDTWLENAVDGYLSRLDAATLAALKNISISSKCYDSANSQYYIDTISRKCFILSLGEYGVASTPSEGNVSYLSALKDAYLADHPGTSSVTDAVAQGYGADGIWTRTRSTYIQYAVLYTNGASYEQQPSKSFAVRPALAINPDTPVSNEGALVIFLLPDGRDTTFKIQVKTSLGSTQEPCSACKLIVPKSADVVFTTLQITNNYNSENKEWFDIDNDGVIKFNDTPDNPTFGVNLAANALSPNGFIGEPELLVSIKGA